MKNRNFEAKIEGYQQDYNNKMATIESKLANKHISAEQYKELSAKAN
jgi:hypothetical protein